MKKINKIVTFVLIIIFAFAPVLARPAQAQWVVWDPGNFVPNAATAVNTGVTAAASVDTAVNTTSQVVKDFGLDSVAWIIVNLVIERMAASTVTWINSGFKGSPAFVTDPTAFFGNLGDKIAGQFIFSNPNLNFLCGPISAKIKLALTNNYNQDPNRWRCTLTQVGKNLDNFMGKFENGGWDNFFELTQKTQNNPIGAYTQAENEMYLQIATRQGQKKEELLQGRGFLSYQKCTRWKVGESTYDNVDGHEITGQEECVLEETVTPGSVISDQLNNVLNTGNNKLAAADEINEIVSALLNQLITHVVGGIGAGLRGLTSPSSTGGQTLTSQLSSSNAGATTDYFGSQQNTAILNTKLNTPADYRAAGNSGNGNLNSGKPTCSPATDPGCIWTP